MAEYSGLVQTLTPASADDNWTLDLAIDEYGEIVKVTVAGEETASAVIAGRIARSASSAGALTAGDVQNLHPHSNAALVSFGTTYATTQPTLSAGAIIAYTINAHGGLFVEIQDPNARPQLVGAETVSCRNDVGVSAAEQSTYAVTWSEP